MLPIVVATRGEEAKKRLTVKIYGRKDILKFVNCKIKVPKSVIFSVKDDF